MSVLSLWCQQPCLVSSFQAIETSLSQLPWRVSGAELRGWTTTSSYVRVSDWYRRERLGRAYSWRSNSNLTVGTELGNSDTSIGWSSTLMRRMGWWREDPLLSSPAGGNTACDCFTLKWTNLWRGKYSGPPRDSGVMSLYEVPSSLSLATTLFAIECKCTCGCY